MKQKKKIIYLFLISSFITLISCNKDEDYFEENQNKTTKIPEIKFDDLIKENKFKNAFLLIPKKTKTVINGKTVMEDQYGFTIADIPAKVIQDQNGTSYTLPIYRENQSSEYFENLVIKVDNSNQTSAYILKYTPFNPASIYFLNQHDSFHFEGNTSVVPIVYNSNQSNSSTNKMIYECMSITSYYCCYGGTEHPAGANCANTYPKTTTVCYSYDDGTSTTGGGGGGGTGGGTGGSTSTSTVYQDPNIAMLNNLTNNAIVKPKMIELQNKLSENKEYGYDFQTNANNNIIPSTLMSGSPSQPYITFPSALANTLLRIHTHFTGSSTVAPDGVSPIPSSDDIFSFAKDHKSKKDMGSTNSQQLVSMTMGRNGNYALVVTDPAKFINFCNEINNPTIKLNNGKTYVAHVYQYFNSLEKKATDFCPACDETQINAILHNLFVRGVNKMLDIGIKVYYSNKE